MKKCPHCGENFNFLKFLMRCGSDTLVAHPTDSRFHRKEHRCSHCQKLFWIEHHPEKTKQTLQNTVTFFFVVVIPFMFVTIFFFHLSIAQIAGTGVILLFLGYPIYRSYLKYVSSELRPD